MPGDGALGIPGDQALCMPSDWAPGVPGDSAPGMPGDWACPVTGHRSRVIDYWSLTAGQMGIIQEFSSQSISGQQPSCHLSLDLENIYTGVVNIHSPYDFISTCIYVTYAMA